MLPAISWLEDHTAGRRPGHESRPSGSPPSRPWPSRLDSQAFLLTGPSYPATSHLRLLAAWEGREVAKKPFSRVCTSKRRLSSQSQHLHQIRARRLLHHRIRQQLHLSSQEAMQRPQRLSHQHLLLRQASAPWMLRQTVIRSEGRRPGATLFSGTRRSETASPKLSAAHQTSSPAILNSRLPSEGHPELPRSCSPLGIDGGTDARLACRS